MNYQVVFFEKAKKDLGKLDKSVSFLILGWVRKNIEGYPDPRRYGKNLTGELTGQWKYRVGKYRLIAKIEEDRIIILILYIGHSKEVYK